MIDLQGGIQRALKEADLANRTSPLVAYFLGAVGPGPWEVSPTLWTDDAGATGWGTAVDELSPGWRVLRSPGSWGRQTRVARPRTQRSDHQDIRMTNPQGRGRRTSLQRVLFTCI